MTYRCNDSCPFCLDYEQIQKNTGNLSLVDFKKNLDFFLKKAEIKKVILTGGEPTLHPNFFEILSYIKAQNIPFSIITNAIKFTDKGFLKRTKSYFPNISCGDVNTIYFSLNDVSNKTDNTKKGEILKKRIEGIKNLAKSDFPLSAIVTINQENKNNLGELMKFLINLKSEFDFNFRLVEFRILYSLLTPIKIFKNNFIDSIDDIRESLEKNLTHLRRSNINYVLWNFPFCYFKDPQSHADILLKDRLEAKIVKIDYSHQCSHADSLGWKKHLKDNLFCGNCDLNDYCSGIERDYIDLYGYPSLKTIKYNNKQ